MQGEHKLYPGTSYSLLSNFILLQKRVSCAATDTEEFPLDLLASKNIAYISCIPASPKIQPFTILPQLPSPLNFIIENLKFLSELQEHSKATRK